MTKNDSAVAEPVFDLAPGAPPGTWSPKYSRRIGELLVEEGLVTPEQLDHALAIQHERGGKIVRILFTMGYLTPGEYYNFAARLARVATIELENYNIRPEYVWMIPKDVAERHELMAIDRLGQALTLAMVCPLNRRAIHEVERITGMKANPVLCRSEALHWSLKRHYHRSKPKAEAPRTVPAPPAKPPADAGRFVQLERQFLMASVTGLVRRTESLGRMSDTIDRLERVLEDPQGALRDIIEILTNDPPLTARLLGIANQERYGFRRRVDTIDLAVRLVGPQETYQTARRVHPCEMLPPNAPLDYERFRRDAVFCARAAGFLAEATNQDHLAGIVAAALLCDIGRLALAQVAPRHYSRIPEGLTGASLILAEQEQVGISHPEAGFILAERWGLPPDMAEVILFHHEPKRATRAAEMVRLVAAAHRLAELAGASVDEGQTALRQCLEVLRSAGLAFSDAARVIHEISLLRDAA